MEVIPLSQVSIEEKVRCFNAAFSDYFVQINMTADYFRERHQMGRVDYDYSFGIWAEGKLCAFIYSGLGSWAGAPTVYNAGTGVIPAFRGQHLVSRIYETALPFWAARGYRQTLLEVITDNVKAIRVYERVGFRKQRRFHIYSGLSDLPVSSAVPELDIQIVDRPDWAAYAPLLPFQPSWEYNQAGVEALINGFHFLHAYVQGALQAFLILQPQ
ncbi:MAG: GNAT family N-acetyltransferase, partial [Phaeodactylibacter sp.]|nr:GNAT family N-acetyltransferase [Phaeodactylibacter sp.]